MSRSEFKAMVTVFFYIQGVVMAEWEPSGHNFNQDYYIEILTKLHEKNEKETARILEK